MSRVGFPALTAAAIEIETIKAAMNFIATNIANGRCLSNAESRAQCSIAVHAAVSPLEGGRECQRENPNQTASVTPIVPSVRIMLVGFERNTLHAIQTVSSK